MPISLTLSYEYYYYTLWSHASSHIHMYSQRAPCGGAVLECDSIVLDCTRSKDTTVFVKADSHGNLPKCLFRCCKQWYNTIVLWQDTFPNLRYTKLLRLVEQKFDCTRSKAAVVFVEAGSHGKLKTDLKNIYLSTYLDVSNSDYACSSTVTRYISKFAIHSNIIVAVGRAKIWVNQIWLMSHVW